MRGHPPDVEALFDEIARPKAFFLVTDMEDFAKQTELQAKLAEYPVLVQGDGYLIYDLRNPLGTQP